MKERIDKQMTDRHGEHVIKIIELMKHLNMNTTEKFSALMSVLLNMLECLPDPKEKKQVIAAIEKCLEKFVTLDNT